MQIGIGCTTRNRSHILDIALCHFEYYTPNINEYKFYIYSDDSDAINSIEYLSLKQKYPFIELELGNDRLGIAKAKNKCIENLKDCDHIFLFDDDCFPKSEQWADEYIARAQINKPHHLMHLDPLVMDLISSDNGLNKFSNCMGVMLYFTKHALKVLGGYDTRFGIYGYEHAEISNRSTKAGLSNGFCSPINTCDYIYTLDIDLNHKGISPPLINKRLISYNSSIDGEDIQSYIDENSKIYSNPIKDIKIELK